MEWGNGVASKHLTFDPDCAPAVIAIAGVPERRCRSSNKAMSGCVTAVAPGIEQGELGSEEETDYATTE